MTRRDGNRHARRAELIRSRGTVLYTYAPSAALELKQIIVPSWTSSGGRWYYDLLHNLGRLGVFLVGVDLLNGEYMNWSQVQPKTEDTLRIWLDTDYGSSRVHLFYL